MDLSSVNRKDLKPESIYGMHHEKFNGIPKLGKKRYDKEFFYGYLKIR